MAQTQPPPHLPVLAAAELLQDVGGGARSERSVQVGEAVQGGQAADRRRQLAGQRPAVAAERRHSLLQQAAELRAAARAVRHCACAACPHLRRAAMSATLVAIYPTLVAMHPTVADVMGMYGPWPEHAAQAH